MQPSQNTSSLLRATQALFYLNTVIWLTLAVAFLIRMTSRHPDQMLSNLIVTSLMVANALAMLVCGLGLSRGSIWFYLLALAILAVNILLSVADQFGLLDFITLVIDLGLLGILIIDRRRSIRARSE